MHSVPQVMLGRPATYEDLVRVPDHLVAEIVDGELWTSPRPAPRHARAHMAVGSILAPAYDFGRGGPGGWQILFEPELHFAGNVLVPDVAGWRRERMPRLPDTAWFPLAPDWVCEVISPSTALLDRTRKLPIYAREGVRHAWIVDPIARTIEVLRLDDGCWLLVSTYGGLDQVCTEPFEQVELEMALLWDEVDSVTAPARNPE
jgi:Uma2 family endonuclease